MFRKLLIFLLLGTFILAACAAPGAAPETPQNGETPYAGPDEPVTGPGDATPGAGPENPYAPAPGDVNLQRGEVFLDSTELLTLESFPPQFMLHLEGSLPTPCHQLRVEVSEPDEQNQIHVDVYSVVDPEVACIQVLEPFNANVPLGTFPAGTYEVLVNGKVVGEIQA